jgi:hypothetical protein
MFLVVAPAPFVDQDVDHRKLMSMHLLPNVLNYGDRLLNENNKPLYLLPSKIAGLPQ